MCAAEVGSPALRGTPGCLGGSTPARMGTVCEPAWHCPQLLFCHQRSQEAGHQAGGWRPDSPGRRPGGRERGTEAHWLAAPAGRRRGRGKGRGSPAIRDWGRGQGAEEPGRQSPCSGCPSVQMRRGRVSEGHGFRAVQPGLGFGARGTRHAAMEAVGGDISSGLEDQLRLGEGRRRGCSAPG